MARTINDIYNRMLLEKDNHPELAGLNSTSTTAIWRLMFYVVSVGIWTFEQITGISLADLTAKIKDQQIHSTTWYSMIGKKFQLGYDLPYGETEYAVLDPDAQVVKYCVCSKTPGGLRIKIAGEISGELAPVPGPSFVAFQEYMERTKAAGDELFYTNSIADELKLSLNIYFDPLVLDGTGARLDGTAATPVQDAIASFLKQLDFNGRRFVPAFLTDAVQAVDGVRVPEITTAQYKYALLPYMNIPAAGVVPDSGYMRIADLTINFIPWQS